jgi:hypothetical protein
MRVLLIKILRNCLCLLGVNEGEKEICICSAVLTEDGIAVRGHRHSDCIYSIHQRGKNISKKKNSQGFITSRNRFVNREEAAKLQIKAGINSIFTNKPSQGKLMSEDLY